MCIYKSYHVYGSIQRYKTLFSTNFTTLQSTLVIRVHSGLIFFVSLIKMKRTRNSSASCTNSSKRRKVASDSEPARNCRESEEIIEGIAVKNEKKTTDYAQFFRYQLKIN